MLRKIRTRIGTQIVRFGLRVAFGPRKNYDSVTLRRL